MPYPEVENLASELDSLLLNNVPASTRGLTALVSQNGQIIYKNAIGSIDELGFKYKEETIYDLASLTKPLATSLLLCRLLAKGKITLKDTVENFGFFSEFHNLKKFTLESLMTHTSGLIPDKPLYKEGNTKAAYLSGIDREAEKAVPFKAELYSDLNYILLGFILEELYGKPLDEIWRSEVADRLDLKSSGFKPRQNKENIAPTENTKDRGLVWGDVHDEKSYYLGGVAGHAGLFSTASDIDKIVQSLLNSDEIAKRVVDMATRNRNENVGGMFGLGWMTKVPVPPNRSDSFDLNGFMGDFAPYGTFGHTGFTGTSLCINPESRIVCILLTNRTYPSRENILNVRLRRLFHNSIFLNLS